MNETTAFLDCRCGACRITLCDPRMRFRTECLCCDCRQRGLISAAKRSGNDLPSAVADYARGIDLYYFANAFLIDDESRHRLEVFKLRDDAFNTTVISACCGTLMCGTHPAYDGCSISVNADSCTVTVANVMENQAVLFGCDIPPDRYAAIVERDDLPKVYSVYAGIDSAPVVALLDALRTPVAAQYLRDGCTTFEALCAGKTLKMDNSFFEESRRGKPPLASG